MTGALLHVRFDAPGLFANDPALSVQLDDRVVWTGSFRRGLDLTLPIDAGPHSLTTRIALTKSFSRNRTYRFQVSEPSAVSYRANRLTEVEITLRYSRLWGNFTRRLAITECECEPGTEPSLGASGPGGTNSPV